MNNHTMMSKLRKNGLLYVLAALLLANVFIWQEASRPRAEGFLTVAFLDVGQGDSIYIEGPNGNQVLIDGGALDGKVLSELGGVMPFGDRTIDALIVTNPDQDHFGGFLDVLETFDIAYCLEPGTRTPNALWREFKKAVEDEGAELLLARRGMVLDLGGGVELKIIFPDRDVSNFSRNDGSIIMRLEYGSTSVTLTGDTTKIIEEYLVNHYPEDLPANILKVAHHGSKTSTGRRFVSAVSPEYAVISNGKDNSYGHPHQITLDTLTDASVKILRTDETSTIVMYSNGKEFLIK